MFKIIKNTIKLPFYLTFGYVVMVVASIMGFINLFKNGR